MHNTYSLLGVRNFIRGCLLVGIATTSLAISTSATAAVILVNSSSELGADDSIDWTQIGPALSVVIGPANVVSTNGLSATLSDSVYPAERRDQGFGWAGNFANGTPLLWNQGDGDLTLTFAELVRGAGAQIQPNSVQNFTAQISVNGGAFFSANGVSTSAGDDSAIFIGLLSDTTDISSVTFRMLSPSNTFAIGPVALNTERINGAIPEPTTWAMMLLGFGFVGGAMRSAKRKQTVTVSYA